MKLFSALLLILALNNINAQPSSYWTLSQNSNFQNIGQNNKFYLPNKFLLFQLNRDLFFENLQKVRNEKFNFNSNNGVVFTFPMADGTFEDFLIFESPIFEDKLAQKYPHFKTYIGQGITNKSSVIRFDITDNGFNAMIKKPDDLVFINHIPSDRNLFMVFSKKDSKPSSNFYCETANENIEIDLFKNDIAISNPTLSNGETLKTYRLALACTGEYATFNGGTISGALSAMVTSMNRVNLVYETELAVRLVLIGNTDALIFTDAANDPYTNNSGSTMLGQNQTTVNNIIGSSNYDIGHVFSTGGGGIAQLGCVCGNSKARGVTGSTSPVGDPFDIDYVAHEMGHQFGGNHTFNSNSGSCAGNRNAGTAFEPGSGVSIMAYAGICGSDNVASNSIAYFHSGSFDEIIDFITVGNGNNCDVATPTGNHAPVIDSITPNRSIPKLTAFKLGGHATDQDGDPITYSWDQMDVGPGGAWNAVSGNAPIFRSYNPDTSATRLFPKLINILNNLTTIGEQKPNAARILNFRLTARDNKAGGGGVTYDEPNVNITVINTTDTFKITYPNTTGIVWPATSEKTITWNVATTDLAPINSSFVNIYLSTNTGSTFPYTLAQNVPNTGSYTFIVPFIPTTTGRIMVEGANNIFFDINDKNISITGTASTSNLAEINELIVFPNPSQNQTTIMSNNDIYEIELFDMRGRKVMREMNNNKSRTIQINTSEISNGVYLTKVFGLNGVLLGDKKLIINR